MALNMPIVAPLLRSLERGRFYSNYHADVDSSGYFRSNDQYLWILNQWIRGLVEVPVVHTTYLIRADVIDELGYLDATSRHEYVVFSDVARKAAIPQYLDNRQVYGYIAFGEGSEHHVEGGIELARSLLKIAFEGDANVAHKADEVPARPAAEKSTRRRFIRLKEFPPNTEINNTPDRMYVSERDSSLIPKTYKMSTDADGFILSGSGRPPAERKVIVIGESVVESMFSDPELRMCSRLEDALRNALDFDVSVLNAGYSGATSLHSFNVFLNKIVPLKPMAVILLTGIVDVDVAYLDASFWSNDCWLEPLVSIDKNNTSRDNRKHANPSFDGRMQMLRMFAKASELFGVPVWYATMPHRQVFEGEYVAKAFRERSDFERQVSVRKQMNEVTRRVAAESGQPLFDLEADLSGRSDIFYDMFHLNAPGSEAVAQAFIKRGLPSEIKAVANGAAHTIPSESSSIPRISPPQSVLDELFEVHLINLDRSKDRLAKFKERNWHLKNIVRAPAPEGHSLDREELVKSGVITEDVTYGPATLGNALSHIGLWKKAVAENRIVTIFEDDTVCSLNFAGESARVLSVLPADWELINWGCVYDPLFMWLDFGYLKANLRFYDRRFHNEYEAFQREQYTPTPIRLVHSFGIQAYSISPMGARKLLEGCLPLRKRLISFPGTNIVNQDVGIDVSMCAVYGSMQAYLCLPPLVIEDKSLESVRISGDK